MQKFTNNATTVLSAAIDDDESVLSLVDGTHFPTIDFGDYFFLTLTSVDEDGQEEAWEILKCISRTGNTLIVQRAQEGTTARPWPASTSAQLRLTAGALESAITAADTAVQPGALGDAASKNTGTSAGTVAAGNHTHAGVYEPANSSIAKTNATNTWTGQQTFTEIAETIYALSGTSPVIDPANGTIQTWILTGNSTPSSAIQSGQSMVLQITAGSYTVNWSSIVNVWRNGGLEPTLPTTGSMDIVLYKIGTSTYGLAIPQ